MDLAHFSLQWTSVFDVLNTSMNGLIRPEKILLVSPNEVGFETRAIQEHIYFRVDYNF